MNRRRLLLIGFAAGVVILDQLSKAWAVARLDDGDVIDVVWTLRFALAFNRGTAFSLGSGSGLGAWLAAGALILVAVLVWRSRLVATRWGAIAFGLILGGAVGNIIDRAARGDTGVMSGAVVDFVDLQWWPVFNLADAAIVCGAILLVVGLLFWSDDDPAADDAVGEEAGESASERDAVSGVTPGATGKATS
jgi:signal peptidase II